MHSEPCCDTRCDACRIDIEDLQRDLRVLRQDNERLSKIVTTFSDAHAIVERSKNER